MENKEKSLEVCQYLVEIQGPPNTFFILENALKKATEYFLKFLSLF